jgi:hypothetical protein
MATYSTLRDRALNRVGCLGQSEAETVAQMALEETMKFVALYVRVPGLIATATATAPADPEEEANAILIENASGFNVSSGVFMAPDRLYVKEDSNADGPGTPYEYLEYDHFQDLKSIPLGNRVSLYNSNLQDQRPRFCYTITPSNEIWAQPLTEDNVLTLRYRKAPAAYSGGTTPEISPQFDFILVNGAELVLKEWLREPDTISTTWSLLENGLMDDIRRYDIEINGQRKRSSFQIHKSYRIT